MAKILQQIGGLFVLPSVIPIECLSKNGKFNTNKSVELMYLPPTRFYKLFMTGEVYILFGGAYDLQCNTIIRYL